MSTTLRTTSRGSDFADVYAAHRDDVLRLAYLLCGDRDLAEDVTADAFARTWPRWEVGEVDDVGAYLRRATVNNVRSAWRRRGLRRAREERRLTGDARGQVTAADHLAERDAVLRAIDRLPDRQRAVVVLRFYEDLSTTAIADVMGITEGTVRSQLHHASRTLRDALVDRSDGHDRGGRR